MILSKKRKRIVPYFLTSKSITINNIQSLSPYIKKNIIKKLRKRNPNIFHFDIHSSFIYQPTISNFYYNNLLDNNLMKPNNDEIMYLKDILASSVAENKQDEILVLPFFKMLIDNIKKPEIYLDQRAQIIKNIVDNSSKNSNLSLAKITEEFSRVAKLQNIKPIKKSTIHYILRNVLSYRFRKISVKTNKLEKKEYIKFSFFFIKIFMKSLKMGFCPIFIDECGFSTINNNFRNWVNNENQYNAKLTHKNTRLNLIMAVSNNKIEYYKISENNTNSELFLGFMKELINNMTEDEKNKSIFILDNLKSHCTLELFEFYYNNHLKILFTVPYNSPFNMIEICFRNIKNIIYKKIYSNKKNLLKDIKNILEGDIITKSLEKFI